MDPLRSQIRVTRCKDCQTTQAEDLSAPVCPTCGAAWEAQVFYLPEGFWAPRQSDRVQDSVGAAPSADRPELGWVNLASEADTRVGAVEVWTLEKAQILVLNDNGGKLFTLYDGGRKRVRVWSENNPISGQALKGEGGIADVRVTDAALLKVTPTEHLGGPIATSAEETPWGHAALTSFAAALRLGAQAELDVDPTDLRVGLQPRRVDDLRTHVVYVADALENGAGYAVELADGERLRSVLEHIAGPVAARWSAEGHAGVCNPSCQNCLRSYDNRLDHPWLDWRLALDVADLALGRPWDGSRWMSLAATACETLVKGFPDVRHEREYPLDVLVSGRRAVVVGHPLWRHREEGWNALQQETATRLRQEGFEVRMWDVKTVHGFPARAARFLLGG